MFPNGGIYLSFGSATVLRQRPHTKRIRPSTRLVRELHSAVISG